MAQERQAALNVQEIDVLASLEREREEGLPRQRQSVPGRRRVQGVEASRRTCSQRSSDKSYNERH